MARTYAVRARNRQRIPLYLEQLEEISAPTDLGFFRGGVPLLGAAILGTSDAAALQVAPDTNFNTPAAPSTGGLLGPGQNSGPVGPLFASAGGGSVYSGTASGGASASSQVAQNGGVDLSTQTAGGIFDAFPNSAPRQGGGSAGNSSVGDKSPSAGGSPENLSAQGSSGSTGSAASASATNAGHDSANAGMPSAGGSSSSGSGTGASSSSGAGAKPAGTTVNQPASAGGSSSATPTASPAKPAAAAVRTVTGARPAAPARPAVAPRVSPTATSGKSGGLASPVQCEQLKSW